MDVQVLIMRIETGTMSIYRRRVDGLSCPSLDYSPNSVGMNLGWIDTQAASGR